MPYIPSDIYEKLSGLNCEEVASRLGLGVRNHRCRCFIHDDTHPSLSFFGKDRAAWNCFVCRKGGTAVNLVKNFYGRSLYDACIWLCREFNVAFNGTLSPSRRVYNPKTYFAKSKHDNIDDDKPFDCEVAQYILDACSLTDE